MTPQDNGAVPPGIRLPDSPITLSSASVYPEKVPSAFEIAALLGYDGIEVMVATDPASQDLDVLRRLSDYHEVPIKSVHAPCLLLTQRVWGREPWGKLVRSKEVAEELGAEVVVVHPPFRWQREYAREFVEGLARMQDETDVVFAVENMFPVKARGAEVGMYSPGWNPIDQDFPHVTLDLSHTAVSGSDALDMAGRLDGRLRHVHLADGLGITNRDEHLVPGRGNQPCSAMLERLADDGYRGHIVLEVNTRRAISRAERMEDLAEALAFTRLHLAAAMRIWQVTPAGEVTRRRATELIRPPERPADHEISEGDPAATGHVDAGHVDAGHRDAGHRDAGHRDENGVAGSAGAATDDRDAGEMTRRGGR